ncbi:hypothetical protein HDE_09218 [Halotydeus destructor]|nr:hypothetical protein HDE_09218 [Halotydeus destructor]
MRLWLSAILFTLVTTGHLVSGQEGQLSSGPYDPFGDSCDFNGCCHIPDRWLEHACRCGSWVERQRLYSAWYLGICYIQWYYGDPCCSYEAANKLDYAFKCVYNIPMDDCEQGVYYDWWRMEALCTTGCRGWNTVVQVLLSLLNWPPWAVQLLWARDDGFCKIYKGPCYECNIPEDCDPYPGQLESGVSVNYRTQASNYGEYSRYSGSQYGNGPASSLDDEDEPRNQLDRGTDQDDESEDLEDENEYQSSGDQLNSNDNQKRDRYRSSDAREDSRAHGLSDDEDDEYGQDERSQRGVNHNQDNSYRSSQGDSYLENEEQPYRSFQPSTGPQYRRSGTVERFQTARAEGETPFNLEVTWNSQRGNNGDEKRSVSTRVRSPADSPRSRRWSRLTSRAKQSA